MTFSERLRRRLANRVWHAMFDDKLIVRQFVASLGLPLPTLYWSGWRVEEIPFARLPDDYVLKASRGWSAEQVLVVRACRDAFSGRLLTSEEIAARARRWNKGRLLAEQVACDWHCPERPSWDYKCYTFPGCLAIVQVTERRTRRTAWMTADWRPAAAVLDPRYFPPFHVCVAQRWPQFDAPPPRPPCLADICDGSLRIAAALNTFLRCDWYATPQGAMFGETCPWPSGGQHVEPDADAWFGRLWDMHCGESL